MLQEYGLKLSDMQHQIDFMYLSITFIRSFRHRQNSNTRHQRLRFYVPFGFSDVRTSNFWRWGFVQVFIYEITVTLATIVRNIIVSYIAYNEIIFVFQVTLVSPWKIAIQSFNRAFTVLVAKLKQYFLFFFEMILRTYKLSHNLSKSCFTIWFFPIMSTS